MGMLLIDRNMTAAQTEELLRQAGILPNRTFVQIVAIGGGSSGANTTQLANPSIAAGGNSGSMSIFQGTFSTLTHAVTIGQGGANAANGGTTSFGTLVSATGGSLAPRQTPGRGIGGNGGRQGSQATVSFPNVQGGQGTGTGGAGGAGGTGGGGGIGVGVSAGNGSDIGGNGGTGYGAGGGSGVGTSQSGSFPNTGGAGAQGAVFIYY